MLYVLLRRDSAVVHVLIDPLDLSNVLLDLFKVFVDEFLVLLQDGSLLDVTEDQVGYLFEVELGVAREGEDLIRILVMHNNKDLRVARSHDLFCLSEEASLFDIENLVLVPLIFEVGF